MCRGLPPCALPRAAEWKPAPGSNHHNPPFQNAPMTSLVRSLVVCSSFLIAIRCADAGDIVTVRAASGRQFHGQVDPRTDARLLWLRSGKPQSFLRRPIAWDRIVALVVGAKEYSPADFRRLIVSPDWELAGDPLADEPQTASPSDRSEPVYEDIAARDPVNHGEPTVPQASVIPVTSIHIEASVANWDRDVEVDGLVVSIYPLDANGQTVPALGTLNVDLIGEGPTNLIRGNPFPTLGRWSQLVRPENVGAGGAVFRLPFQGARPDIRGKWDLGSFGMVHARLSVAGQGVFEDTAAFTRIRPYSPIRDRMQQLRGARFHPWELIKDEG